MSRSFAKFPLGEFVRHRVYGFRGVVFDIDPEFNNSEEWYDSIPAEVRPRKNQPFYHLLAENHDKSPYVAYVSEQNLELEESDELIDHPDLPDYFTVDDEGRLVYRHPMN
tara:strand:+ start:124270 stop:124599 length:330 start_codon:yes stop_codon:yes gene_type:complete